MGVTRGKLHPLSDRSISTHMAKIGFISSWPFLRLVYGESGRVAIFSSFVLPGILLDLLYNPGKFSIANLSSLNGDKQLASHEMAATTRTFERETIHADLVDHQVNFWPVQPNYTRI